MSIQHSVSITDTQDRWLTRNNISLSKLVQKAIDSYMASESIALEGDKAAFHMVKELEARGYHVEVRKQAKETRQ